MEELEGKVIRYIDLEQNINTDGYVVGCDFDIGVTIVENKNRDDYLYCLRGPSAMPEYYKDNDLDYKHYNEEFENIIAMFKEGFLDMGIIEEICRKYNQETGSDVGSHTCAFNK